MQSQFISLPIQFASNCLSNTSNTARLPVTIDSDVEAMLSRGAVCALSVSGGKDSDAMAIATVKHLNAIGHKGPRVLIHADLGVVEWKDSQPSCQRLAENLGLELITVKRKAGDMMDRWEGRWSNNVARYESLACVKMILPWSTPSMRFCTSELKGAVLSSGLRKRFPKAEIVSVVGVRRQESSNRAKMPVSCVDKRLVRASAPALTWNSIIDWPVEQVFSEIASAGLVPHEAYTKYNSTRVSCVFCIMSSASDLVASAKCEDNQDVYRRMVQLEVDSTYAFQGGKWLGDVAPHLLGDVLCGDLATAKVRAAQRIKLEAQIPKHLLFVKNYPTALPTYDEASLIAGVRSEINDLLGLRVAYLTAQSVQERYAELTSKRDKAMQPDEAGLATKKAKTPKLSTPSRLSKLHASLTTH